MRLTGLTALIAMLLLASTTNAGSTRARSHGPDFMNVGVATVIAEESPSVWLAILPAHVVGDQNYPQEIDVHGQWVAAEILRMNSEIDIALIRFSHQDRLRVSPLATECPSEGGAWYVTQDMESVQTQILPGVIYGTPVDGPRGRTSLYRAREINLTSIAGDSGGPLIDVEGNMLGMVVSTSGKTSCHVVRFRSGMTYRESYSYRQGQYIQQCPGGVCPQQRPFQGQFPLRQPGRSQVVPSETIIDWLRTPTPQPFQPAVIAPPAVSGPPQGEVIITIESARIAQAVEAYLEQHAGKLRGEPGSNGRDGATGSAGPAGSPGASVVGPQGPPGQQGPMGPPPSLEVITQVVTAVIQTNPEIFRGPQGQPGQQGLQGVRGEKGEPGLIGVPTEERIQAVIKQWAATSPEVQARLQEVSDLSNRIKALEAKLSTPVDTSEVQALRTQIAELENRIVPIVVNNPDGTIFSQDANRKAFDPIEFNLQAPK